MQTYTCPGCHRSMEEGFVGAGRGLRWRSDGRFGMLRAFNGETLISMWSSRAVPATRCRGCGLVLIAPGGH